MTDTFMTAIFTIFIRLKIEQLSEPYGSKYVWYLCIVVCKLKISVIPNTQRPVRSKNSLQYWHKKLLNNDIDCYFETYFCKFHFLYNEYCWFQIKKYQIIKQNNNETKRLIPTSKEISIDHHYLFLYFRKKGKEYFSYVKK